MFLIYLQSIRGDRKLDVLVHGDPWSGFSLLALVVNAVL
jgi:hypothetical protein